MVAVLRLNNQQTQHNAASLFPSIHVGRHSPNDNYVHRETGVAIYE
eukprot:XP_001707055.1 Hypothetical protein GL50803_39237 [Giardia lamblia ATCC 50803]